MPLVALLLIAAVPAAAEPPRDMGQLEFRVSGSPQCQQAFTAGMLALHSFMYEEAHEQFARADPGCAMARWGDAMSFSHGLWGEEEPRRAQAALAQVVGEEKLPPLERDYLRAARALWGTGTADERHRAWLAEAARMHREHPGDDEVALQHALALMTAEYGNVRSQMEAGAIALDVFARRPRHPGAAHYVIHAFDSPDHAILALPAARAYARIAPAAQHALHMPSHTFVQLGMWADVAASNEASWAADEADAKRRKTALDRRNWHSYSWLAAAYAELGQRKKAERLLQDLARWMAKEDGPEARYGYSSIAGVLLRDGHHWGEAQALAAPLLTPLPLDDGEAQGSLGCAMHAPGGAGKTRPPFGLLAHLRGLEMLNEAAMRRGDEAEVRKNLDARHAFYAAFAPFKTPVERFSRADDAYRAGARAYALKTPEAFGAAIAAFKALAAVEETSARTGPLGPAFDPLAREELAGLELAAGQPREALADFDKVLDGHPMLSRSLLGAARAARAAGDAAAARARYSRLLALWSHADPDLPDLREVRTAVEVASAR